MVRRQRMTECCETMRHYVEMTCEQHPDPQDCPDIVVRKYSNGDYGIPVRDGGSSYIRILNCPWCRTELPEPAEDISLREKT